MCGGNRIGDLQLLNMHGLYVIYYQIYVWMQGCWVCGCKGSGWSVSGIVHGG